MDLGFLFIIFALVFSVLVFFQVTRILLIRRRNLLNERLQQQSGLESTIPEVIQIHSPDGTINNQPLEERWLFKVTPSLLNKVLIGNDRELRFVEACSIQTLDPLPKFKENCYFEIKILELPETTQLTVGLAQVDNSNDKIPGKLKYSIGYESITGSICLNDFSHEYGNKLSTGDVVGCGYRPMSDRVYFTQNGRRFPRVVFEQQRVYLYPTVYANGPCSIEFNFGQSGFVLVAANTRQYGLTVPENLVIPPPSYNHHSIDLCLTPSHETSSLFSDFTATPIPSPTYHPPPYNSDQGNLAFTQTR